MDRKPSPASAGVIRAEQRAHLHPGADGGVGVLPGIGPQNPLDGDLALFIVGPGQKNHKLGRAAGRGHVSPAELGPDNLPQMVRRPVQTVAGQRFFFAFLPAPPLLRQGEQRQNGGLAGADRTAEREP